MYVCVFGIEWDGARERETERERGIERAREKERERESELEIFTRPETDPPVSQAT